MDEKNTIEIKKVSNKWNLHGKMNIKDRKILLLRLLRKGRKPCK